MAQETGPEPVKAEAYAQGWRDACEAIAAALDGLASTARTDAGQSTAQHAARIARDHAGHPGRGQA